MEMTTHRFVLLAIKRGRRRSAPVTGTNRTPKIVPLGCVRSSWTHLRFAEPLTVPGPLGGNASANCSASCRRFVEVIVGNESRGAAGGAQGQHRRHRYRGRSTAGNSAGAGHCCARRDAVFGAGEQVRPVRSPSEVDPAAAHTTVRRRAGRGTDRGPTPAAPSGGSAGRGLCDHRPAPRRRRRQPHLLLPGSSRTLLFAGPGRFSL